MYKNFMIALAIFLLIATAQATNLVTNGTFDSNANGWTFFNVDGNGGYRSTGGNPGGGFIINDAGALGSDPTLQQSITGLIIGETYTVSGDYRMAHGSPASNAFGVQIDGNLFEFDLTSFSFSSFSETFVATSTSALLVLTGERNGTDTDPMVDNISIVHTSAAVPEPTTFVFMGIGLLFAIYRKRG